MSTALISRFWDALLQTLLMVSVSGAAAFLVGLPLALLLYATDKGRIWQQVQLNRGVGAIVNGFRSLPFIILLVALIPLTRMVVGTSIGTTAAIVPLSIAAIPFYARIAEVSLNEVDSGLIEAVKAMGGSRWAIITQVLIPEALPGLVAGFTVTLVSLINASAMAGAVGGGGLGDLAIRYGYQRFDTVVMINVIIILIVLVCSIQWLGDWLSRQLSHR